MLRILSTDSVAEWKSAAEPPPAWQHSESTTASPSPPHKRARRRNNNALPEEQQPRAPTSRDPLDALGADIFQSHILPLMDARALTCCVSVSSQWRTAALTDKLWQPLVASFLSQRAHLPLCLMGQDVTSKHRLFAIAMTESLQRTLLRSEMCGRTWEMRLKPLVGAYWLSFDPSQQVGKRGLNRYFGCDGGLAADPGDPIWGGHACAWEFVRVQGREGELVQINHWPPLVPRRMADGRWVLENSYGSYVTRADNPAFSGCDPGVQRRVCGNSCQPPTFGFNI